MNKIKELKQKLNQELLNLVLEDIECKYQKTFPCYRYMETGWSNPNYIRKYYIQEHRGKVFINFLEQ